MNEISATLRPPITIFLVAGALTIHQMECKLNELKTSVVYMIENLEKNRTYADVSKSTSSVQASFIEQPSMGNDNSSLCASYVDEGYGDQSGTSVNGSSSQTQLKTT